MSRILFFALILFLGYLLWKKIRSGKTASVKNAHPAVLKQPLSPAQQSLFARLQNALPSTLIMVQPALSQLVQTPGMSQDLAQTLVDFAICRRDSTPIGVVQLDDAQNAEAVEQCMNEAGLKYVRFSSTKLPDDQQIRNALDFLS